LIYINTKAIFLRINSFLIKKIKIFKLNLDQQILSYPDTENQYCFEIENNSPWFLQRNDFINFYVNKYDPQGDF
jgi:hypothetical protein